MAALLTKELQDKSEEGRKYYTTRQWENIRKAVLQRDNFTCQKCGRQGKEHATRKSDVLIVHHKKERTLGGSDENDNLETLCPRCHILQPSELA